MADILSYGAEVGLGMALAQPPQTGLGPTGRGPNPPPLPIINTTGPEAVAAAERRHLSVQFLIGNHWTFNGHDWLPPNTPAAPLQGGAITGATTTPAPTTPPTDTDTETERRAARLREEARDIPGIGRSQGGSVGREQDWVDYRINNPNATSAQATNVVNPRNNRVVTPAERATTLNVLREELARNNAAIHRFEENGEINELNRLRLERTRILAAIHQIETRDNWTTAQILALLGGTAVLAVIAALFGIRIWTNFSGGTRAAALSTEAIAGATAEQINIMDSALARFRSEGINRMTAYDLLTEGAGRKSERANELLNSIASDVQNTILDNYQTFLVEHPGVSNARTTETNTVRRRLRLLGYEDTDINPLIDRTMNRASAARVRAAASEAETTAGALTPPSELRGTRWANAPAGSFEQARTAWASGHPGMENVLPADLEMLLNIQTSAKPPGQPISPSPAGPSPGQPPAPTPPAETPAPGAPASEGNPAPGQSLSEAVEETHPRPGITTPLPAQRQSLGLFRARFPFEAPAGITDQAFIDAGVNAAHTAWLRLENPKPPFADWLAQQFTVPQVYQPMFNQSVARYSPPVAAAQAPTPAPGAPTPEAAPQAGGGNAVDQALLQPHQATPPTEVAQEPAQGIQRPAPPPHAATQTPLTNEQILELNDELTASRLEALGARNINALTNLRLLDTRDIGRISTPVSSETPRLEAYMALRMEGIGHATSLWGARNDLFVNSEANRQALIILSNQFFPNAPSRTQLASLVSRLNTSPAPSAEQLYQAYRNLREAEPLLPPAEAATRIGVTDAETARLLEARLTLPPTPPGGGGRAGFVTLEPLEPLAAPLREIYSGGPGGGMAIARTAEEAAAGVGVGQGIAGSIVRGVLGLPNMTALAAYDVANIYLDLLYAEEMRAQLLASYPPGGQYALGVALALSETSGMDAFINSYFYRNYPEASEADKQGRTIWLRNEVSRLLEEARRANATTRITEMVMGIVNSFESTFAARSAARSEWDSFASNYRMREQARERLQSRVAPRPQGQLPADLAQSLGPLLTPNTPPTVQAPPEDRPRPGQAGPAPRPNAFSPAPREDVEIPQSEAIRQDTLLRARLQAAAPTSQRPPQETVAEWDVAIGTMQPATPERIAYLAQLFYAPSARIFPPAVTVSPSPVEEAEWHALSPETQAAAFEAIDQADRVILAQRERDAVELAQQEAEDVQARMNLTARQP